MIGRAEAVVRSLAPATESRNGANVTRLHEVVRARPGFENAVQAALGEIAEGVLARDLDEALTILDGEASLAVRLDARSLGGDEGGPGRPLADCVEILDDERGDSLRRLLAGIYVADDARSSAPENGYVVVTREGLRLTRTSASSVARADEAEEGEFVRGARLEAERRRLEALRSGPEEALESLRVEIETAARRASAFGTESSTVDSLADRTERAVRAISSGPPGGWRSCNGRVSD